MCVCVCARARTCKCERCVLTNFWQWKRKLSEDSDFGWSCFSDPTTVLVWRHLTVNTCLCSRVVFCLFVANNQKAAAVWLRSVKHRSALLKINFFNNKIMILFGFWFEFCCCPCWFHLLHQILQCVHIGEDFGHDLSVW